MALHGGYITVFARHPAARALRTRGHARERSALDSCISRRQRSLIGKYNATLILDVLKVRLGLGRSRLEGALALAYYPEKVLDLVQYST